MKTKIFIVDDHAVFRKGLGALINSEQDMAICGEGDDCINASHKIRSLKPDVVITDITLRGADGIELIKNIQATDSQIKIIVLSMHDEAVYALRVLRSGARAYIMKTDATESVISAIRKVRQGLLHVSEYVESQMLNRYAFGDETQNTSAVSALSDRELEVLNLIGAGVSTRDIAGRLHISIKTVETHRAHLKTKLNLTTATQLLQFAFRWIDRSPHVGRDEAGESAKSNSLGAIAPSAIAPRRFA